MMLKARIAERDKVRAQLLRLGSEDRLLRFGNPASETRIETCCNALDWHRSMIIGHVVGGELCAIGELRPFGKIWLDDAEIALSVERSWQNQGIVAWSTMLDNACFTPFWWSALAAHHWQCGAWKECLRAKFGHGLRC